MKDICTIIGQESRNAVQNALACGLISFPKVDVPKPDAPTERKQLKRLPDLPESELTAEQLKAQRRRQYDRFWKEHRHKQDGRKCKSTHTWGKRRYIRTGYCRLR